MRRAKLISAADTLALAALCALCIFALFQNHARLREIYPSASLRYSRPIPTETAGEARRTLKDGEANLWPTFWSQVSSKLEQGGKTLEAVQNIRYDGDARLVWPARYLAGARPGELDSGGCAVSSALAYRLWGSLDAIGQEIRVDGRLYTVRGIYAGDTQQLLTGYGGRQNPDGWQAVELAGELPGGLQTDMARLAQSIGLPAPDGCVMPGAVVSLGGLMAWFPLCITVVLALMQFRRLLKQHESRKKEWLLYAILGALALCLPWLLAQIPAWVVPNRWSDLSHWGNQFKTGKTMLHDWFTLVPYEKDAVAKSVLLSQLLLCFGALLSTIILWWRLRAVPRMGPAPSGHTGCA